MDFHSFVRGNRSDDNTIHSRDNNHNNTYNPSANNIDDITKTMEQYSHMSDAEMMQALFGAVNKEKMRGTFNIDNIWQFYRDISPMLDEHSRKKMADIISSIKDNI